MALAERIKRLRKKGDKLLGFLPREKARKFVKSKEYDEFERFLLERTPKEDRAKLAVAVERLLADLWPKIIDRFLVTPDNWIILTHKY